MQDDLGDLTERREESSMRFWERKARFTYYAVSLPFVFIAVAVSSYPYGATGQLLLVSLEIVAWLLLLSAGAAGLRGKWGEMELLRKDSIIAALAMHRAQSKRPRDAGTAEISRRHENRRILAEKAEQFGMRWLFWLLGAGLITWLSSCLILAFCSVYSGQGIE